MAVENSTSSSCAGSLTSNEVAPSIKEEILVAHSRQTNAASHLILKTKSNTGALVWMYCSYIYWIILNAEFIYPWSFFLLNIQFNYCRTKSFSSHQLRHGIQHHLKASQAKVWQSLMELIDQTASATLLKEKGIYAQGDAISYHPLPSSSHKLTFRCRDHGNLAR